MLRRGSVARAACWGGQAARIRAGRLGVRRQEAEPPSAPFGCACKEIRECGFPASCRMTDTLRSTVREVPGG